MSSIELKHKWVIDPETWYIRLYLYTWAASRADINFCKLFWGYVFFVPCWIVRIVAFLPVLAIIFLENKREDRLIARIDERRKLEFADEPVEPKRPSLGVRFLNRVGDLFTKLSLKFGDLWFSFGKLFIALGGLVGVGLIGWLIYLLVKAWNWNAFFHFIVAFGAIFGVAGVIIGVLYLTTENKRGKKATLGFFRMFKLAFIAVKTNTCPDVVLKEKIDER